MQSDERATFTARLAERGLSVNAFDGRILSLTYNAAADHSIEEGHAPDTNELAQYAESILRGLPDATQTFAGLEKVVVDGSAL
jgi:hypothetical protein